MKIAAIDVGSNSIKLVVVEAAASDSFAVLARDKVPVRLGHDTLRLERLSTDAIERAAQCIKSFRSIAETRGADRIFAVATAAVREAQNAPQFIKEVKRVAGVSVEILSPIEEARLIGVAAVHGCAAPDADILNIDIGGGSTELSLMRNGAPASLLSVKLGAVGITEKFLSSDPPKPKELRALREEIRSALERPARELIGSRWQQVSEFKRMVKELVVWVDDDFKIQKTEARLPKDDRVVTTYRNQRPTPLPASTFEFTPPSGTEISQPLGK